MPNISDRRKLSIKKNSINANDSLMRSNTNNSNVSFHTPAINQDYKRVIRQLQEMLKQEKARRVELQEYIEISKQRTVLRQKQFFQILTTSHKEVNKYLKGPNSKAITTADQILVIFQQIFDKFEQSNEATNIFIEKRYKDNLGMMERRIFQILDNFQIQKTKNKRLSEESYRNIRSEIDKIVGLAKNIEDKNLQLQKKLSQISFKNKILSQQKQLLVRQLTQKKKLVSKMYNERKIIAKQAKIFKTPQNRTITNQHQQTSIDVIPKFLIQPSIDVSDFKPAYSQTLKSKMNSRVTTATNKKIKQFNQSMTLNKKMPQSSQDKVIENLKLSLARERKKNLQLGKIVTKIQSKNDEINSVISEAFIKAKQNGSDKTSVQVLLQCQKLFQTIRQLKKRLSTCQQPSVNCGWGNTDANQLLSITDLQI